LDAPAAIASPSARLGRGYMICLIATIIWSTTAIFIRYLTQNYGMPPLLLAFWRDFFTSITVAIALALISRPLLWVERRHLVFLACYGLALAFLNTSWTISVALNGAAVSTVLVYSSPAVTAVVAWRLLGERLDRVKVTAVILSLVGCALVSGAYLPGVWRLNLIGVTTGLISGLAMAAYNLMGKGAALRQINPWSTLLYSFSGAAAILLVINLGSLGQAKGLSQANLLWLGNASSAWLVLAILAMGPTIAGYGLYIVSLVYLPAGVANLIATLEPVSTAILAYLLLAERLSAMQLVGSALVAAGIVLLRIQEGQAR
jgi:drug/metabolite transporter (DMT)-like permease